MPNVHGYQLIRSARKTLGLQVKDGTVIVRGPKWITRAQADSFVREHHDWIERQFQRQKKEQASAANQKRLTEAELLQLKTLAREVIPERVRFYAGKVGVTYGRITIRAQHTRWGSCSEKGNLNFNCLLMLMPEAVLDSVVVHELCHRKEMNHSARFYALVRRVFPDYDKWNQWLKKNGSRYLAMLPG